MQFVFKPVSLVLRVCAKYLYILPCLSLVEFSHFYIFYAFLCQKVNTNSRTSMKVFTSNM